MEFLGIFSSFWEFVYKVCVHPLFWGKVSYKLIRLKDKPGKLRLEKSEKV